MKNKIHSLQKISIQNIKNYKWVGQRWNPKYKQRLRIGKSQKKELNYMPAIHKNV